METTNKPKLIMEARGLITSEYKLKLLNPASDEPLKPKGGLLWEREIKGKRNMAKRLNAKLHRLYFEISLYLDNFL